MRVACHYLFIYFLFSLSYFIFRVKSRAVGAREIWVSGRSENEKKTQKLFFFSTSDASETTDPILSIDKMSRSDFLPFFLRKKVQLERVFLVVFFIGLVLDFDSWTRVLLGPLGFIDVRNNRVGRI